MKRARVPIDQVISSAAIACGLTVLVAANPAPLTTTIAMLIALAAVYLLWARRPRGQVARTLHEHQLLVESLTDCPMPLAVYDTDDRLIVWNRHYERLYGSAFSRLGDAADARGLRYGDLIRSNAPPELGGSALESYIAERIRAQHLCDGQAIDREYPEQGWFRISKYRTESGAIVGFAVDINELKQREAELLCEIERRKSLELQIRSLAYTDSLTGIANRRSFVEHVSDDLARCRRERVPAAVLMIDIDHFKQINDTHGHSVGDEVIKTVCRTASTCLRDATDIIGRLGGEEFAVFGTERDEASVGQLAERIRTAVESLSLLVDGHRIRVSVSVGVAELDEDTVSLERLLERADEALYSAKGAGRNRVCYARAA